MKTPKNFLLAGILSIVCSFTYSQTIVTCGNVSGTWTLANSPYIVNCEVVVPVGDTLTIEPGVEVKFKASATMADFKYTTLNVGMLTVKGRLIANGTAQDSIIFTRSGTTGHWGVVFIDSAASTTKSTMKYCRISYSNYIASYPLNSSITGSFAGALAFFKSKATVENCLLIYNNINGIECEGSAPDIINCIVSNSQGGGIFLYESNPNIIGTIVTQTMTDYAIGCHSSSPVITNSVIANNNVYGIVCEDDGITDSSPTITNTIIWGNIDPGWGLGHPGLALPSWTTPGLNTPTIFYSLIQGIQSDLPTDVAIGTGNVFNANPLFNSDYSLQSTSPCKNTGTLDITGLGLPATDIIGNPRVSGGRVDMGACEYQEADILPPAFVTTYPKANNILPTTLDVLVQLDEPGTAYFLVLPGGAPVPTIAQVKAGTAMNVTTANTDFTTNVAGLTHSTAYDIYFIAEDDETIPNVQDTTVKIDVTTAFQDVIPPAFVTTYPKASNILPTALDVMVQLDESGTAYFLVLPGGAPVPTIAQVKAGTAMNITTANTDFTANVTGLTTSTVYDFYFVAEDDETPPNVQDTTYLLTVSTLYLGTTGFNGEDSNYEIYPNPAKDILNIKNLSNNIQYFSIRDISGRSIVSKTVAKTSSWDISVLNEGIYFVEIRDSENQLFIRKLLIKK